MRRLARAIQGLEEPAVEKIAEEQQDDPFQILIATMLSAQTRDEVTAAASRRLFRVARTPKSLARLPAPEIERLIYPVSFYRNKAVHVREACQQILDAVRRCRAPDDGGTADAAWRRQEDGEPRADPGASQQPQHLRRHARAPHLESPWLGGDQNTGRDRTRLVCGHGAAVVACRQLVPGDVGAECLPSGLSAVSWLRGCRTLSENRRHENGEKQSMKRDDEVVAGL